MYKIKYNFFFTDHRKCLHSFFFSRCYGNSDSFITSCILSAKIFLQFFSCDFRFRQVFLTKNQCCLTTSCNCIIFRSAGQIFDAVCSLLSQFIQEKTHQFIGICTIFIDFCSGMSTVKTIDQNFCYYSFHFLIFYRDPAGST